MAITIQAQLAKKTQIPGLDYSSHQASIAISAEVSDPAQVIPEAQRLYRLAEQAVDAQLGLGQPTVSQSLMALSPTSVASAGAQQGKLNQQFANSSISGQRPSSPPPGARPSSRRAPAPVTDSQLRFLDRLITQTGSSLDAILHRHQVAGLPELSCKQAAALIDELKGPGGNS